MTEDTSKFVYFADLVTVSRIHAKNAANLPNPNLVQSCVASYLEYSAYVLLCIDIGESYQNKVYIANIEALVSQSNSAGKVRIIPISPWGRFVSALNSAILVAKDLKYRFIAFQSMELTITATIVSSLLSFIDANTLVVGPVLSGHEFSLGATALRGRTCPWNTFAIWSMEYISKFGFALASDGDKEANSGGVEEVVAINLLQSLYPRLVARLVLVPNVAWATDFNDASRESYHTQKMISKDTRPALQMKDLNCIPDGVVQHICL